jgi:hypothetical protein
MAHQERGHVHACSMDDERLSRVAEHHHEGIKTPASRGSDPRTIRERPQFAYGLFHHQDTCESQCFLTLFHTEA